MARRMIDPRVIIKSQVVDDKNSVDLNEILEKYGTQGDGVKSITLQTYFKQAADDVGLEIRSDTGGEANIIPNGAITMTKNSGEVYIVGPIVNGSNNLLHFIEINDGNYENGIILGSPYKFDVHVIRV